MRAGGVPGRRSAWEWERAGAGVVLVAFMDGAGRGLELSGRACAFQGAEAGRACTLLRDAYSLLRGCATSAGDATTEHSHAMVFFIWRQEDL